MKEVAVVDLLSVVAEIVTAIAEISTEVDLTADQVVVADREVQDQVITGIAETETVISVSYFLLKIFLLSQGK